MAKKMWGGRFKKKTDKDFFEFQKSISYDYKLAKYDIFHSLIHISALKSACILTDREAQRINSALREILKEIKNKKFKPNPDSEDIHTEIQNRVEKKTGRLARKLHTLRSRNDQIVFDEKMYCDIEAKAAAGLVDDVVSSLEALSKQYPDLKFIGYTHTQRAQPISFADYLAAFIWMFTRDEKKLLNFSKGLIIYIGSGALRGTSLIKEYDKAIEEFLEKTEEEIPGKIKSVKSPADNVSDRDFMVEFLSILAVLQMHLSRLAEDFILYSTKEFNYFDLPEEFCTGSSLMPHKKNADFLELVRGNTGRIYGNLVSLLTTMKALPLTYNRDMQLDKEPLFSSLETIKEELKILARLIKGIKVNKEAVAKALKDEGLYATDLAEYLVRMGLPFSSSHEIAGRLARYCEDKKCSVKDMDDNLLKKFSSFLNKQAIARIFK